MSHLRAALLAASSLAALAAPAVAQPLVPDRPAVDVASASPPLVARRARALATAIARSPRGPRVATTADGLLRPEALATLADCSDGHWNGPFLCGTLDVPADPAEPALGTRTIDYMVRLADRQPATGVTLFTDGPVQSTFSDRSSWKPDFFTFIATSWNAQLATRDVILVNTRGTGRDTADCPLLQTPGNPFPEAIDECVGLLGPLRDRLAIGHTADDLEAVRAYLQGAGGQIDVVAKGHATTAIEAYLARHADHVRSAVLADAADYTAFSELDVREATRILGLVCNRSARCARRIDDPVGELAWLARRLRRAPITGRTTLPDGTAARIRLRESDLVLGLVVGDQQLTSALGAGLPAAIRAFRHGDAAPLLRLAANAGIGEGLEPPVATDPDDDPVDWSGSSFAASFCNEFPTPYDLAADEPTRRAQAAAALAAQPADLYGIFSHVAYANWSECWHWPGPDRPSAIHPAGTPFADVPVLVLTGDLDAGHPSALTHRVAGRYPRAVEVEIPRASNQSIAWSACAARIQATFLDTLATGDTACEPTEGRAVLGIGAFPQRVRDESPARRASRADRSRRRDRRVAATTVHTLLDAVAQAFEVGAAAGPGLRGGTWATEDVPDGVRFTLDDARFAGDVAVSGDWLFSFGGANPPGTLRVHGAGTERGVLTVDLPAVFTLGVETAHVTGRIGGRRIDVEVDIH